MSTKTPALDNDIAEAVREDDIESIIAEARECQEARDGYGASPLP
jgi:hypothetical protein